MATTAPRQVRTTCCYCGVGCGIVVSTDARGRMDLQGDPHHPGSQGQLCSKGRTLLHTIGPEGRLTHPLLRDHKGAPLRRATWDEAIAKVAEGFTRIQTHHGRDALALYVSGQCLTEEYYMANKLAKGCWGTNNIDTNSRLCMSSAVAGYKRTLGADSVPVSYTDLDSCDTFLFAGSNAAWTHPIIFRRVEARRRADPDRVRLICIDPRRTETAALADAHHFIRPGSDPALTHHLGLFLEGRLSGVAEVSYGFPGPQDAYLGLMLLAPWAQGAGHGRAFLAHVESLARSRTAPRIYLAVLEANPRGRAFWEREGFAPTGLSRADAGTGHILHRLVKDL
jgi:predicted molibdopterin-dependent oxidoreductase YjgC